MTRLPTGTVTFLFTDVEGSTRMLRDLGHERYVRQLSSHDCVLRHAIEQAGGLEVSTEGDGFFAVFRSATAAIAAAVSGQRGLHGQSWPEGIEMRVRMGLHTGTGNLRGDDYAGIDVHRAARVAAAAHGGQVLVSASTYEAARDDLPGDVGLVDLGEHVLRDLDSEHLYQLRIDGLPSEFPPLRTLRARPFDLPLELTSMVGRDRERAQVIELLRERRLLTLTGTGGTGKTRLAAAVAAEVVDEYPGGVAFVSLAGVSDPESIPTAILGSLGLRSTSGESNPREQLLSYLAGREMLLLLDNFEQLLDGRTLIAEILRRADRIRILVTSRAPLHMRGEREVPVPPLSTTPPPGSRISESVRLFLDRATDVRPDLEMTSADLAAIATLVERLDGLPLAIELAASRLRVLSPADLLERLGNQLLSDPGSDLPSRQRTISDTIDWSYGLLAAWPQRLFERCSVFVGGARLEELEAVCVTGDDGAVDLLAGLTELVDHSLLYRFSAAGGSRFGMLGVVQEFAREVLAERPEAEAVGARHLLAYRALIEEAEPRLLRGERARWLSLIAADHDNIRAAIDRAVGTGDAESALVITAGMWRFWQTRGPLDEASRRISEALAVPGEVDPRVLAKALSAKGGIAYWRGDFEGMLEPYARAVEILRASPSRRALAGALYDQSFALAGTGDHDAAWGVLEESMALARAEGDAYGIARAHWGMFDAAWYQGDALTALRYAELAAAGFEKLDAPFDLGWARYAVADCLRKRGRHEEARTPLDLALPAFHEAGDLTALILFFEEYAALEVLDGHRDRAARLIGATESLKVQTGMRLIDASAWSGPASDVHELVGQVDEQLAAEVEEGRRMSVDQAVAYALAHDPS